MNLNVHLIAMETNQRYHFIKVSWRLTDDDLHQNLSVLGKICGSYLKIW